MLYSMLEDAYTVESVLTFCCDACQITIHVWIPMFDWSSLGNQRGPPDGLSKVRPTHKIMDHKDISFASAGLGVPPSAQLGTIMQLQLMNNPQLIQSPQMQQIAASMMNFAPPNFMVRHLELQMLHT